MSPSARQKMVQIYYKYPESSDRYFRDQGSAFSRSLILLAKVIFTEINSTTITKNLNFSH